MTPASTRVPSSIQLKVKNYLSVIKIKIFTQRCKTRPHFSYFTSHFMLRYPRKKI